ncbi:hypothetical protein H2200_010337 [Cladophialophora chaetospira]|uniref:FAD/NAD(P)-binding domain-containing protein n=1 Tax=Cladophialophora chaetospira TaxID=386627 RepID=A0AA38X1C6_9EURO|nr:hypothetical protein H2200_010337 [Cladophialophora chaetospira]
MTSLVNETGQDSRTMLPTTRNIVVLGGNYAGSSIAHLFLKHMYSDLPQSGAKYRLLLVNPSTTFYHRSASPRAAADLERAEKSCSLFSDLAEGFSRYTPESFTFIQGLANKVDLDMRTVTIRKVERAGLDGPSEEILHFHALWIATGASPDADVLNTVQTGKEEILSRIKIMNAKVNKATDIVIAGGGPTAVELAGEIGEHLNGAAGRFYKRPSDPKARIRLISDSDYLLQKKLSRKHAGWAEQLLTRVGVDVVSGVRTTGATKNKDGSTSVLLNNGTSINCDLFIPATGYVPNTSFLPKHILDERGFVKTNEKTLRVDNAGPRVYCVGDVGTYTRGGLPDLILAVLPAMANFKRDLLAAHDDVNAKPTGLDKAHEPLTAETLLCTVGYTKGLGVFTGRQLPYFMTYRFKVKDYFDCGHEFASGSRWEKTKF